MGLFGTTRKHDEADIRILLCTRWTNLGRRFSEEEIGKKLERLYPHRTFDVKKDIAQAVVKGLVGTGKVVGNDSTLASYFITQKGWELIKPKWNGVKMKKEEMKKETK